MGGEGRRGQERKGEEERMYISYTSMRCIYAMHRDLKAYKSQSMGLLFANKGNE